MHIKKTALTMLTNEQALKDLLWRRAANLGVSTVTIIEAIWASHLMDAVTDAQSFLRLAQRYSPERVEAAAHRAVWYGQGCSRAVKRILRNGADRVPPDLTTDIWGHRYYGPFDGVLGNHC